MAVDGYLNFDTKINTKGFNTGTKQIGEGLMNVKQKLGKVGAAVGAAFSVKALIDFGKSAIETASDLQEVQNVVDVSFGELGYKMEAFADKAIESFGISELAAKKTGSTFMAMAKGMDVAEGAASDIAISLTGLSADMASFYHVDQETAATALKSVFTGETETLKQFGIVMNEANLKAFALSQGITKSYDSMTQAEKVQLRYAYVMKQTAFAQGDFARTSDSWANQTNTLSQKWKQFSGIIGTALVQTLLPAVRTINAALDKLISAAKAAVEALAKVFGWEIESNDSEEKAKAQADALAQSVDNQEELTEETKKTNKAANDNLQSFDRINKLQADSKDSKEDGGIFTLPTESKYTIDLDANTKKAQKEIDDFIDKFGPPISKLFSNLVAHIKACIGNIVDYINGIITVLKGVIQFITGVFTGDWDKAWTGIKNIFSGIFDSISSYIKIPLNGVIGAINRVLSTICTAVNVAIRAINKISVDLPEWAGGYHIGFDFAEITPPQIPYLAKGTVVPANYGEFLAVLGDNKRETEVVSPLSTIEKALENVMSRHSGQGQDINLKVYLDGDVVYQNVVKHNRNAKKSMGVNPLAV